MSKKYYSDYISHMIRFYVSQPVYTDDKNWKSVHTVLQTLTDLQKALIVETYTRQATVLDVAKKHNVSEAEIWKLIVFVQKKIAKERGLI